MARKSYSREDVKALAKHFGVKLTEDELDEMIGGMDEEREHDDVTGGDPRAVFLIALAHVGEIPDYYARLYYMQEHAKGGPCMCFFGKDGAFALPSGHKLGVRVPTGGSMCANCYWLAGEEACRNREFQSWRRTLGVREGTESVLPFPANQYCCDLWERTR